MAPKTAATNSATSILSDALSSFSKAAHLALVTVEERARTDVAHVNAEVLETRRERDEAVEAWHKCEIKIKEWERRADGWKTTVEKSELTINHQAETIAQLREESQQWKNQLLRFEDASRREIQDWKDQYQRAEAERIRLSARLDELIAEQLKRNTRSNAQNTTYGTLESAETRTPAGTKRATSGVRPAQSKTTPKSSTQADRERTYVDGVARLPTPTSKGNAGAATVRTPKQRAATEREVASAHKTPARQASASTPRAHPAQATQQAPPRQTLIRRVHAVIEVPVKEEDDSDEDSLASATQSVESIRGQERRAAQQRPGRRSSVKSRPRIETEDEEDDDDDDEYQEEDEEDDQLLIGAEENHSEVYGSRRVSAASEYGAVRPGTGRTATTSRKRKLGGDAETSTRTAKAAKKKQ